MGKLTFDRTNALCGALFIAAGLFFMIQSLDLEMGTAFRMGPGYFPMLLSGILVLLGLIVLIQATRVEGEPAGPLAWRGMLLLLPAPILFGLTVRGLGFVPAIFLAALVASFASRRMTITMALVLSLILTVFSVAVFSYGLNLPFQRFGPWLRF
ncbi:tripartite tricarboxylate transporter TctB family protein [Pseudaminobacter sp. 19-2017]|uniref:Tripartite tricarboxylate transporter TctB family protein n=1 Tax=Pseudaminobacter soli (ex Zhang et al. 2022) TaxID=2831468 RepID=A0A942I4P2_9HYPH|nr:tripartite tricarboxylate transporter TctB family protein [Pseudaminobacter soli]MBS3652218.1 tripartite tricarboxylate transporter TctB family protein [Pseudaminobacter soli]